MSTAPLKIRQLIRNIDGHVIAQIDCGCGRGFNIMTDGPKRDNAVICPGCKKMASLGRLKRDYVRSRTQQVPNKFN